MRKFLPFTTVVFSAVLLAAAAYPYIMINYSTLLVLNADNTQSLPRVFRQTPLQASSSAQFSEKNLEAMIELIPNKKITVVDLRGEPHGFINGKAISWYSHHNWVNFNKAKHTILTDEDEKINEVAMSTFTFVFKHEMIPIPVIVDSVMTEEKLVRSYNQNYIRIPVTDHHKPSDASTDTFVALIRTMPKDSWLHFHCSAGKGRSSTFMTMLDMIQNEGKYSFQEFIERQILFGGTDLLHFKPHKRWKHPFLQARVAFLQQFHRYCQEEAPHFTRSWSQWKRIHKKTLTSTISCLYKCIETDQKFFVCP